MQAISQISNIPLIDENKAGIQDFSGIDVKAIEFWKRNLVALTNLKKVGKLKKRGFMAFDVETKDGLKAKKMFCYALSWFEGKQNNKHLESKVVRVKNNLDMDWLFSRIDNSNDKTHKKIIFVHNLGFDARFLINYCVRNQIEYKTLLSGSQIINLAIDSLGVVFRDSAQYLQSSQEKAEIEYDIDKELCKIDCKDLFNKHYKKWSEKGKKRVLAHNKNDVKALLSILDKFRTIMHEIGGVDMLTTYSLASLSMKIFRTEIKPAKPITNPFVFTKWNEEKGHKEYQYDKDRANFVRKSYFGGRTEVFDMNTHKNSTYIDRVSMYPAEMFYNYFPSGIPSWVNTNHFLLRNNKDYLMNIIKDKGKDILTKLDNPDNLILSDYFYCEKINEDYYVRRKKYQFEGFMKAKITPNKFLKYPILPQKLDKKLMFTNCERTAVYSIPELRYAYDMGYTIEPIKALIYSESIDMFTSFIQKLFLLKSINEGGKRKSAKICMNSSYGKFGQAYERTAPLMHYFQSNDEMFDYIADRPKLKRYKAISNKKSGLNIIYEIVESTTIKPFMNVGIASYITGYSRIELSKQMFRFEDKNIDLFYTDSDSITVESANLSEISMSKKLGGWDIEQTFDEVKFLAPKSYIGISNGKPFLKMKGVDRSKIEEIKRNSKTIEDIERQIREPIQIAEKYMSYRESHRYGLILATKKRCKHYSFENWKRDFQNGTSKAWNDDSIPAKFKTKKVKV